jgi:hypothetical protein
MSLDEAAILAWVDAGCSVIPIQADGTKRPAGLMEGRPDRPRHPRRRPRICQQI